MPRPQDHGTEPHRLSAYMKAVRLGAPPEEIARLKAEYRKAVAERKHREIQRQLDEAQAELQAVANVDG